MAALTILACEVINQLWDLTDALLRTGFNVSKSLRYLRAKQRQHLFNNACRAVWQRELRSSSRDQVKFATSAVGAFKTTANSIVEMKKNSGIDFAAIEASAEALDAVDNPYASRGRAYSSEAADFDQLDDIEVLAAVENDNTFYEYATLPVFSDYDIEPLHEGVSYTITGDVLMYCERFSINFILEDGDMNVALHINPRLPQNYIVRNTKAHGNWGREEVSSALPFSMRRGKGFTIQVLVTDPCYMISVNGYHFAEYTHRLPYSTVGGVEVKGDVANVTVTRSVVSHYPERMSPPKEIRLLLQPKSLTGDVETAKNGALTKGRRSEDETDGVMGIPHEWYLIRLKVLGATSPAKTIGLALPYYGTLPAASLKPGRMLKIVGRVNLLPHSFYINLQEGRNFWPHATIAFHFNPRFSVESSAAIGRAIVCRNAWYNGRWGSEERSRLHTDFRPGKSFSMTIACTEDAFEVYVNNKLITNFRYQIGPEIVDTVYVRGDIKLWSIDLQNNPSYIIRKPRSYQNPGFFELSD